VIKLTNHPRTVAELRLIRAWLRTLSRTHISESNTYLVYPNPAFIRLLHFHFRQVIRFRADHFEYPAIGAETLLVGLSVHVCARTIAMVALPVDTAHSVVQLACRSSGRSSAAARQQVQPDDDSKSAISATSRALSRYRYLFIFTN
jgi:hypothetical protein